MICQHKWKVQRGEPKHMPRGKNQLNKDGMTAGEREEARRELVLAGRMQHWRKLMGEGKEGRAWEYAGTYKFLEVAESEAAAMKKFETVIAANLERKLVPVTDLPAILTPAEVREREEKAEGFMTRLPEQSNGWPVRCVAEVWRRPVNPRLVVIQLDDGRQARLYNATGRRWSIKSRVRVKLVETSGEDAIYEGDFGDE